MILCFGAFTAQTNVSDYLSVAIRFTETGQYEAAIKVLNKLEQMDNKNPDVFYLRGINFYLIKDYSTAIKDFDKVLELDPQHADVYLYRAKAKKANNNLMGALSDYNKARNGNFSQTITSLAGDVIKSIFTK
ncbi:MAG: tetratricopeptide repeat protein [Bacteroidales bacterium]|nr:tetratricopeptide repeat protein [Bacteroidales bacterium]